ncbi:glutamate-1-semialdehyde 2,1-aminomutase [Peptococcaceae bacterium]|nr:glutamate-1-semialdehyde 2,1-aminomutase [Peptococcaceae bacterium]
MKFKVLKCFDKSIEMFREAQEFIPGGVNSPVRAFKAVGGDPLFIERADKAYIWDVDGNKYIDYVCSWGPMILGHRHPSVVNALREQLEKGTSFGAPTELETELAKLIIRAVPSIEKVRMVNSGTEATMSAIRLARGYTKRNKIVKFEGCYHGHADFLLIKAGSGALTLGVPSSPGVPESIAQNTISVRFNDKDSLKEIFEKEGEDIAAVVVEPIAGNMGVVLPQDGYLEFLRDITKQYGSLLIFDEVMTGFRVSYGGAQSVYNIVPDITCLGKIIGGGLPVGAYGGKREIMAYVAPEGEVYQAGTLSGNPLAMAAGIATLKELSKAGIYQELEEKSKKLEQGIKQAALNNGIPITQNRAGSMLCTFFTSTEVVDYDTACTSDTKLFARFFRELLKEGIYIAPSQFEAMFVSIAHTDEDIDVTIDAVERVFKRLV